MLAVSKLSPGQEAYYERSVAAGIDDYYAGKGESPGVWVGHGAAELELSGVVGEGELGRLVNGRHPLSAAVLRRHPPKRVTHVERIDAATGERRLEAKTLAPVAGFDLVFSAPKSVSLLHALAGEDVRQAVTQAHLAAWQAALAYLEQEACVTRKGRDGVVREHASGFVAAAYLVEGAGGKAILVGDAAQLPAVGAGGLFAAIIDRCGAIELKDNRRQRDELERRALDAIRGGDGCDYLAYAARRQRLVVADDPTGAKARLLADWWQAARADPVGSVMIAYRRRDVRDLNTVARSLMEREGRLGNERLALPSGIELACGDRIVCLRNERRLGLANGTRGTITGIDKTAQAISLESDDRSARSGAASGSSFDFSARGRGRASAACAPRPP